MSARDLEYRVLAQLRIPPQSSDAEAGVLGSLLTDNGVWERCEGLSADDFYRSENRLIFAAVAGLIGAGKPADAITVYEHLVADGKAEEAGDLGYIASLSQGVPNARNAGLYAEIVREKAVLRKTVTACDEIAAAAFNPEGRTVDAILDEAQKKIGAIGERQRNQRDEWISAYDGMVQHSGLLDARAEGKLSAWPTGLTDLDEYLEGGLLPGNLVIVGARPSMGKTALGMTVGVHMARERGVGMLSMEMSHTEVRDRLTAMLGGVSLSSVKRPRKGDGLKWDRVLEGVDKAKELRFYVSDQAALTINQVRSKARALRRTKGMDVLIVDYIGLMQSTNTKESRNIQLGEISRGLKALAKELQIAVLCLAQLNRKAEDRPDSMPQMSDLRDSGEIEQDADVILFIKRPIMANPDLGGEWRYYAKLGIAKNRQGRCGVVNLSYLGEQTKFSSWGGPAPVEHTKKPQARGME